MTEKKMQEITPLSLLDERNTEFGWSNFKTAYTMLKMFDWDELIESERKSHSTMHITDPTGYKELIENPHIKNNLTLCEAARDFIKKVESVRDNKED